MSVTALPFALTPSPGGIGTTPPVRTGNARTEAATASFGHWLQRAQPSLSPTRTPPQTAPQTLPPPCMPPAQRPDANEPSPQPPVPALTADAEGQTEAPSEPSECDEPASAAAGEPSIAWWWRPPEAPATAAQCDEGPVGTDDPGLETVESLVSMAKSGTHLQAQRSDPPHLEPEAHTPAAASPDELSQLLDTQSPTNDGAAASMGATAFHSTPLAESPASAPTPWVSAATSAAPTMAAHTSASVATPSTALPTPVYDADFPQALAQHITVLVRQGIQEAQIQLNPGDMGMVSVHIAVSGQQAQVEFAASASATRAALEASFSHLAAALHEAGLTLTGGGVSHDTLPRRQAESAEPVSGVNRSDDTPPPTTALRTHIASAAGRLDLYV
jgi:flagellar hook-length control protein FliK